MEEAMALLEVQTRDLEIMRLSKQLDEMPEKRAILAARGKLNDIRRLLDRTEAVGHAIDADIRKLEDETAQVGVKMDAEQTKMASGDVTNPKELQALARELDSLRRRRESLESAEMEKLAKREAATAQSEKVRAALAAGEAQEAALVVEFKTKGSALLSEMQRLKAERERLAAELGEDLAARYEKVCAASNGIGAGRLEGDMCGVCRVTVPTHTLDDLRAGPAVGTCPNCARLLVIEVEE